MKCNKCGFENGDTNKFCINCGKELILQNKKIKFFNIFLQFINSVIVGIILGVLYYYLGYLDLDIKKILSKVIVIIVTVISYILVLKKINNLKKLKTLSLIFVNVLVNFILLAIFTLGFVACFFGGGFKAFGSAFGLLASKYVIPFYLVAILNIINIIFINLYIKKNKL